MPGSLRDEEELKRADLKYGLEISLEEAASGITTDIRVPSWEGAQIVVLQDVKKEPA